MSQNITVVGPYEKKHVCKVTPSTTLKAILVEACEAFRLNDANKYCLRISGVKPASKADGALDLSLTVRFANFPKGTRLELSAIQGLLPESADSVLASKGSHSYSKKDSPSLVQVVVQLDDGQRLTGKFNSMTSLWSILRTLEDDGNSERTVNVTHRTSSFSKSKPMALVNKLVSGTDTWIAPVCLLLNREYASLETLTSTTLESCGYGSGSVLIRVNFKNSGISWKEVMPRLEAADLAAVQTSSIQPVRNGQALPQNLAALGSEQPRIVKDSVLSKLECDEGQKSELGNSHQQVTEQLSQGAEQVGSERRTTILRPRDNGVATTVESNALAAELPDSFYELSSKELAQLVAEQSRRRQAVDNAPLMTKAMREKLASSKTTSSHTVIRVRFPDQFILESKFLRSETVGDLMDELDRHIATGNAYYIYTTPPFRKLEDRKRTFGELGLCPASVIHFNWVDASQGQHKYLKEEVKLLAKELDLHPAVSNDDLLNSICSRDEQLRVSLEPSPGRPKLETPATRDTRDMNRKSDSMLTNSHGNVPKWLKFSGLKK